MYKLSFNQTPVAKGDTIVKKSASQAEHATKTNAIKEEARQRIIEEAGRLGQEMVDQADAILEPILSSLEKGKLSKFNRIKLTIMKQELVDIKQLGTRWIVGDIAVNNKAISLNITPSKLSFYGKTILRNLNLLPSELKANVSCSFSEGSCSVSINDLKTKEVLYKE